MRRLSLLLATTMVLAFSSASWGTLFDRGGGLIYDSALNITWLQDANYAGTLGAPNNGQMSWSGATTWAANLVYGGYSDWRLPTTPDAGTGGIFFFGFNGIQPYNYDYGYNMTTSEMGYMFYETLGNVGLVTTSGANRAPGTFGLTGVGPFQNFGSPFPNSLAVPYWSGTQSGNQPTAAWYFDFYYGNQNPGDISGVLNNQFYAWAVRDGDVVPIPEPTTMLLLGSGLVGLIGFGRRRMKK